MPNETKHRSVAWLIGIGAVVAALLLIGAFSDWFGLFGTELTPGATTPPNNPS